jgi:hypothetical protein
MQMAAPAVNSNYAVVTSATASNLDNQFHAADQAYALLPKGPSVQRSPQAATRRQLGGQIHTHLDQLITQIRANFAQHTQNMDGLANRAKVITAQADQIVKGAADPRATPTTKSDAARLTAQVAGELIHIVNSAEADSKAFFASWNQIRALNMIHTADEFKDDFVSERNGIMQDVKLDTTRLVKMRQLKQRSEAYMALSQKLLTGSKQDVATARAEAVELVKKLQEHWDNTMSDTSKIGLHGLTTNSKNLHVAAQKQQIAKVESKTLEGIVVNLTAALKNYKTTVKTMTALKDTTVHGLSPEEIKDGAVAASLMKAQTLISEALKAQGQVTLFVNQAQHDIVTIRAHTAH